MKFAIFILIVLCCLLRANGQGTACSSAIPLGFNGVVTNYATSSSTGTFVVCTNYTSTSPITWFSFTTNATAECPLLNISTSDHANCEVALYTGCGGNMTNNLEVASSMCFDDGEGLWAPSEALTLQANHTYYLRVKTSSACTLSIGSQFYTPSNNNCSGAFSIGTSSFTDNNACHKPSSEVLSTQLCAFSLENTAFYKFYVATTGSAIINISSIACDNGNGNNSSGFQIGFFTGTCGSLVPVNCTSGSGSFVQGTTNPLPAGSLVYVAIDGVAGSNCKYSLSGINVFGALSTNFKNFSAWKTESGNDLKWTCFNDTSAYYIIERSEDGVYFQSLGRVNHPDQYSEATNYSFMDMHPIKTAFYRVKQVDSHGYILMSQVITVVRKEMELTKISVHNPVSNCLHVQIETDVNQSFGYAVVSVYGQQFLKGSVSCNAGITQFDKEIASLPSGRYILIFHSGTAQIAKSFIKFN